MKSEDGMRDAQESRGLGDVYKKQFLKWEWENELILNDKPSVPFLILISLYTPTHLRVMKRDIFNIKTSSVELVFLYTIFQ